MNVAEEEFPVRLSTPLLLLAAGPLCGAFVGAMTNAINDTVCSDYFAIIMSWDGEHPLWQAMLQGVIEGGALGAFFGIFIAIAAAASSRLRCPARLALQTLALATAIVVLCWLLGGAIGVLLSLAWPQLWGNFFTGVPPRVSLPHFAWVGGTIWGAYGGTPIALIACSIFLHLRWRRIVRGATGAFAVVPIAPVQAPSNL